MKKLTIADLRPDGSYLLPDHLGEAKTVKGGVYVFEPGETAHGPVHVHDVDRCSSLCRARACCPSTGWSIRSRPGTCSSSRRARITAQPVEEPLVSAWYLMDRWRRGARAGGHPRAACA